MASVTAPKTGQNQRRPLWLDISFEIGIVLLVYLAYSWSRGSLHAKAATAFQHARQIIDIEKMLGILVEPRIQSFFLAESYRTHLANALYTVGYYPSLVLFAVWAYWRHRDKYMRIRTAFVISAVLAFAVFALYPMAPPRFFDGGHAGAEDLGFVDTLVTQWHVKESLAQAFYNPYAAMPSCHFAWGLMIGIALWWMTKSAGGRTIGLLLPLATFVGITSTANHFILDALGGTAVTVLSLMLAAFVSRAWAKRTAGVGGVTPTNPG